MAPTTVQPPVTAGTALAGTGVAIEIDGVVKRYRTMTAVDHVSLTVEPGEFLTLLGSSGSGKSTLLNIIAGFIPADSGRVAVGGRDLTNMPPHKRDLGMVFQHYALFPHMSVWDNVAFPLRRRKVAKSQIADRVQQALDVVELGRLAERRPAQLSGGQQQRVALARALVFRPQALLMDEPLGALDKRLRQQLQVEIKRLHRELGTTFVFVTHDQEEALAMSDRIAVLRDGRLVQVGTPVELYERPASRYVAEFLGESNIFTGRCARGAFVDATSGASFAVADHHVGDALVVRPEHVRLATVAGPVPSGHNAVTGVAHEVTYLGAGLRVDLDLPDGRRVIARTGTRDTHVPQVGDTVVAHWDPDHALAVTDDVVPTAASVA